MKKKADFLGDAVGNRFPIGREFFTTVARDRWRIVSTLDADRFGAYFLAMRPSAARSPRATACAHCLLASVAKPTPASGRSLNVNDSRSSAVPVPKPSIRSMDGLEEAVSRWRPNEGGSWRHGLDAGRRVHRQKSAFPDAAVPATR